MILVTCAIKAETKGFKNKSQESLMVTGIGKLNAGCAVTYELVNAMESITSVVNLGTAGATSDRGTIHDVKLFTDGSAGTFTFPEHYEPVRQIIAADRRSICATDDTFVKRHRMHDTFIYDMEAYALAKVCHKMDVPFHCYKIITDAGNLEDWNKQLPKQMAKLWSYYYNHVYRELAK